VISYARWNGTIIGQGGPTNDQFADVWEQLATHYASDDRIIFGTMNEPHDSKCFHAKRVAIALIVLITTVPDIDTWADTVQAVVTAIRSAGATSQMILLPGNDYTSAAAYISDGSAAALSKVTNPDGENNKPSWLSHKAS
jgi:endoglucanase